jgi:hypothetical protein
MTGRGDYVFIGLIDRVTLNVLINRTDRNGYNLGDHVSAEARRAPKA